MAELGALSLRIQEEGGEVVLQKLKQIDTAAALTGKKAASLDLKATPLTTYFRQAEAGAHRHGAALSKAQLAQKALNQEIAEGTRLFALQARTVDITSDVAVAELRASAAAQREWLIAIGASTEQQQRFNAAVLAFESRLGRVGMQAQHAARGARSAGSAVAALAIASTLGGVGLREMATSAGLAGSVMAAEFAPVKWAGYASAIGVAVIAVASLIGIIAKLRAEQAKPSPFSLQRIEDIKQLTIAEEEYAKRQRERLAIEKRIEDRPRGFLPAAAQIEELNRLERLNADLKKARELEDAAFKRQTQLRNQAVLEGAEIAKRALVSAAESTKAVRLSELAKEQAAVDAAFAAGTASLAEQYDVRRKVIVDGAKAEREALEAQRAALLKAVPGETAEQARGRAVEAGAIAAEITALANATAARLTALDAQRLADEKALAGKVLGYQAQLERFSDTAFEKRLQQIAAEDAERRKTLAQRGHATQQELADLDALAEKQRTQVFLQKAQADLARLREDLALRLQAVENRRLAGLITEEEASREIVDISRSALPTLQQQVDLAIQFAEKLGDQGVLGALKAIKAELAAPVLLSIDIDSDAISRRLNQALDDIRARVSRGVLDAEAGRRLVQQEQFGAGIATAIAESVATGTAAVFQGRNPLQALGQVMSQSLGSLLVDVGAKWLKASVIMQQIQTFFAANPVAAIAAAAAMIALGSALGGTGARGGVSVGGGFAGSQPTPLSLQRLIVDPNAGVRQRIGSAGPQRTVAAAPAGPMFGRPLVVSSPEGQRVLTENVDRYNRRGG